MQLRLRTRRLDLTQPVVMGVLNVTPDSFSDGGRHVARDSALRRAREMVAEGATIIDVGGESTRPGAQPVPLEQELERVVPVIEALHRELEVVLSVDTMKPEVMRAACAAGAELVNDVRALRNPGSIEAAAAAGAAVCLMHMRGEPQTMQDAPEYDDVVAEVAGFLEQRIGACVEAGFAREQLIVDPGFGFGKTLAHNLQLLASLGRFANLGCALLVGVSRKSMFRQLLGRPVDERLAGGLAAAALAVWQGAHIIRTHDVRATMDAIKVTAAIGAARTA